MKFVAVVIVTFFGACCSLSLSKEIPNIKSRSLVAKSAVVVVSQDAVNSRIINGKEVLPHSKPYLAYLVFTVVSPLGNQTVSYCAGSLISENYVLTAGHCTFISVSVDVYLGVHNILAKETTQQKFTSTTFITHKNFNATSKIYDIGLVKLSTPATLTSAVRVAKLPSRAEVCHSLVGQKVTMFGWGLTASSNNFSSEVPMGADSTVLSDQLCAQFYGAFHEESQLCTSGFEGQGACSGDSGGPLENQLSEVVGIVSYRLSNCVEGTPTVFTKVGSFLNWIEEHSDVIIF